MNSKFMSNRDRALAVAAWAFLAGLAFGGGSSRDDVVQFALVQATASFLLLVILLQWRPIGDFPWRAPALMLAMSASLMIAQIIPLPPVIWENLPGREFYVSVAEVAGFPQPWRPISLSPDRTVDSLLGLLPVAAAMLLICSMPRRWDRRLLTAFVALAVVSSILAAFQLSDGPSSALRFYRATSNDAGVGLLANRNHQATLLAMGIPIAAWWGIDRYLRNPGRLHPIILAASTIVILIIGIFMSGSRMGLANSIVALLATAALVFPFVARLPRRASAIGTLGAVAVLGVISWLILPDSAALERSLEGEPRLWIWPTTIDAIAAYFPVGTGVGTFVTVYPRFEALANLTPQYINRAHNDYLEILLEAGIFGAVLAALFFGWFARACWRTWRIRSHRAPEIVQARACSIVIVVGLLASLTDYALRTSLVGAVFVVAALMLHRVSSPVRANGEATGSDRLASRLERKPPR